MSVDIVIPLGTGSKWQDNEIRYALRSIEKYLRSYGNIFIIGRERKWLKDVLFIEAQENYTEKQLSIFNKLLKAAKDERVSETFCYWHDDHCLLRELEVREIKNWCSGTLDRLMVVTKGSYQRTVINSNRYLKQKGYGNRHFDIHVPMLMEKEKVRLLEGEDWKREHIIKSLYGNKFGLAGEEMRDLKFNKAFPRDEIMKAIDGRLFFSYGERGCKMAMKGVLQELYPEKSKFEI